jgi:hypothetical protein
MVAVCGLVLAACASTVPGVAVRARSSGDVDGLTAMLLSVEDIRTIIGAEDLEVAYTYEKFLDYLEFEPESCIGVPFNTIDRAYSNSGYQAVSGMVVQPPHDTQRDWVDEGVVQFATAAAAHRFVTASAAAWRNCAGKQVRAVPDKDTGSQVWQIAETVETLPDSRGFLVRSTRVDRPQSECAHTMADRADLVIDVVVCSRDDAGNAETILERIASRPPV